MPADDTDSFASEIERGSVDTTGVAKGEGRGRSRPAGDGNGNRNGNRDGDDVEDDVGDIACESPDVK